MKSQQTHDYRCLRAFADGRRCRMLRKPAHPSLCPFHAREEEQRLESERLAQELAQELASLSGNFNTGLDINHVLGKVFKALAQRKISARDANAFAYLAQLMLHSMSYVENEIFWATQDADAYHRMVRQSIPALRELTDDRPAAKRASRHTPRVRSPRTSAPADPQTMPDHPSSPSPSGQPPSAPTDSSKQPAAPHSTAYYCGNSSCPTCSRVNPGTTSSPGQSPSTVKTASIDPQSRVSSP